MPMAKSRPQLGSGVAFAPDGRLWLVGVNPQGGLFVQRAGLGATSGAAPGAAPGTLAQWEAPRVLDTQGDPISADSENRPKLAFGPRGQVVISYTQPLPKPNTGFIRMLRSSDGGQTFSAPFTVHTDRQEITHRFEAIGFDAQGALHTVWIDKRDLERAPKVGKQSSYRGAAIYRNVSLDGGATFGPDLRVADHSCECCRIAIATGADGRAYALWRHVFEPWAGADRGCTGGLSCCVVWYPPPGRWRCGGRALRPFECRWQPGVGFGACAARPARRACRRAGSR